MHPLRNLIANPWCQNAKLRLTAVSVTGAKPTTCTAADCSRVQKSYDFFTQALAYFSLRKSYCSGFSASGHGRAGEDNYFYVVKPWYTPSR
jgi:hypothetical protein